MTWKGRIELDSYPIMNSKIKNWGILAAQRKEGPFRVEIEYVNFINNSLTHKKRYNGFPPGHSDGNR